MATVGTGAYTYEVVENWGELPSGWSFGVVTDVAVDSKDRVYVFQRKDPPIIVFDTDGKYLSSWGSGSITFGYGIHVGPGDVVYLTDREEHVALKYSSEGVLLMTLGTRGQPSDTGCTEDMTLVPRPGEPFNKPTKMVPSPTGELYVSDGYRNSRVHRFSPDGQLISSWGNSGKSAPGEFHLPHSVWVDDQQLVYICDRENDRIQIFSASGDFVDQWTGFDLPADLHMDAQGVAYISELGYRVSVVDKSGNLLARWEAPRGHGISGDSGGDIYLAEVHRKMVTKYVRGR